MRHSIRLPLLALLLTLFCAGISSTPLAHAGDDPQQAVTQKKLTKLKQRIHTLAKEQRQAAARRDSINGKLADQSDALAKAAAAVRQSEAALADNQRQLDQLLHQRDQLKTRLADQREALAELLRAAYKVSQGRDLHLLFSDADLAKIARVLAYSRYFQHDRMQRIKGLLGQLDQLRQVQDDITQQRKALEATRSQRSQHTAALQQARQHQRQLLSKADAKIKTQQQRMRQLQQQQKSLQHLLSQLRDALVDIPDKLPADAPFRSHRGKLPWPVSGPVHNRAGGIYIEVVRGTTVRAVAHGRIAYANWLRGYGLLVVIDHGNGWMTLYGDNESVLHGVGEWVNAGEPIATAGAGTGADAGVYFGLRHDSKPVHPLPWLTKPH